MQSNEVKNILLGFPVELVNTMQYLPPMNPLSVDRIATFCYPGPRNTRRRNKSKRSLAKLLSVADYLEPQGDQQVGALAYFGYRWTALTVDKPPKRPTSQEPLNNIQLMIHFPDLRDKIYLLRPLIIKPNDLHEFLAGIHGWCPLPDKCRKRKFNKIKSPIPGEGGRRVGMEL